MKKLFEIIKLYSQNDVSNAEDYTLKSMEELGELVRALFHENGYKPTNKSIEDIKENQLEEACDVIICMFGVLNKLGFSYDETIKMLNKKSDKWINGLKNYNKTS